MGQTHISRGGDTLMESEKPCRGSYLWVRLRTSYCESTCNKRRTSPFQNIHIGHQTPVIYCHSNTLAIVCGLIKYPRLVIETSIIFKPTNERKENIHNKVDEYLDLALQLCLIQVAKFSEKEPKFSGGMPMLAGPKRNSSSAFP